MNDSKRHHYLPQFYLRAFSEDDHLWVFDRKEREYREQTPTNTAVERDYYAIIEESGAKNRDLEKIFADIESRASNAIGLADSGEDLTQEERAAVAVFCAFLKVRTPNFQNSLAEASDQLFKKVMKLTITSEERAAASIAAYERDTGSTLPLSPKELLDFFQGEAFMIQPHRNQRIAAMIEMSAEFAVLLAQMDWVFVHAPVDISFTTSDVPFGTIPPADWDPNTIGGVGMITPGAVKYVPLTGRTALLMFDRGFVTRHCEFHADHVTDLNLRTTARTERFAIAHSRAVLESLVSATGIDLGGTGPRMRVQ